MDLLKKYYNLTKPGIIYGNLINATAGFWLGWSRGVELRLLPEVLVGLWLVIASACVFNNCLDRSIDSKMARTKRRALVLRTIPLANALIFGVVLGLVGLWELAHFVNLSTAVIALVGFVDYVFLYTLAKRYTRLSTLIGSIAGATPIFAGYTAATNSAGNSTGSLVFLMLLLWQMPHFYSIGLYRREEYKAADLPILPVVRSARTVKVRILAYIIAFTVVSSLLTFWGSLGYIYLAVMLILGLTWLWKGLKDFNQGDDTLWGKKMFRFSLIVILVMAVMLSVGARLP